MKLREIAYARSGDKSDTSNICVFPYDDSDYPLLVREVTEDRVATLFGNLVRGEVTRYEIPANAGLNFVLTKALGGGVSLTLRSDPHGKSFQSLILDMDIDVGSA
jgi:hypothetical protein